MSSAYAELAVTTNFSFLRGASHPEEFVATAKLLEFSAIGIADRNTLAGVVRAYNASIGDEVPLAHNPRLLIGARLVFSDGTPDVLAYPQTRAAYANLCRLLTAGKLRAKKGDCLLTQADLIQWQEGLSLAILPPPSSGYGSKTEWKDIEAQYQRVADILHVKAGGALWLAATMPHQGQDQARLDRLKGIARRCGVALLATNDAIYHVPERRPLQDVVTCIREHLTLEQAGRLLEANAERHLKTPEEMARLFANAPEAVAETAHFANSIQFSLSELKYNYPDEPVPPGKTAQQHLEDITWEGARQRYPAGVPEKIDATLKKELALIAARDYAAYFLTVKDIVGSAESQNILCQGRGSSANSAVCYVLGITCVNPAEIDLLFERFVNAERQEPPDIDVDFEHERREEVIQNIYKRYGSHRAALTATVICYRPRSAIREVGKVFGLSEDVTAALAGGVWGSYGERLSGEDAGQDGHDINNNLIRRALQLTNELIGFPRHLSQHVGGFVLTRDRLDEIVPIGPAAMQDRYFIEWDKDDIDRLSIMKVDVLGLGMLTCIRKAFALIAAHEGQAYALATIPREDKAVYEMLSKGDSIGVFQVESRAQMNMLPRLRPQCFYDLVIQVAIVRPGPIQGDMVHPYLRRRNGAEDLIFPSPAPEHGPAEELRQVLGRTLGVPLFQEQAMKLAIVAAKFSPSEANQLRRAMATFRSAGTIQQFETKMVEGMTRRGYARDFALRCFEQIKGFGTYGFPESHAASFAQLVYVSAWIKRHHPAAFACALLNSQPMGFYAPAEIVSDARSHGVAVVPVDVNFSTWDNSLEQDEKGRPALRLGFRQISGFSEDWAERLCASRDRHFTSIPAMFNRTGLPKRAMVLLAEADCFGSLALDRREALWAVRRLADGALPLFATYETDLPEEKIEKLPVMPACEHVVADYQTLRLSLKGHPMQFLRPLFKAENVRSCAEIVAGVDGTHAACAGVVLIRQRPGTASGTVFVTLSDETGIANAVIWPKPMETFRKETMGARLLLIEGQIQKSPEGVVHLIAQRLSDRSAELNRLLDETKLSPMQAPPPDPLRHPRNVRILPRSRDFH